MGGGEEPTAEALDQGPRGRISGIDICRSVAILFAMVNHTFAEFGVVWDHESFLWLKFAFAAATPIFVSLFGAMLELVYVPRFRGGQAEKATGRLLNRAAQCYVLYVITVVALVAVGKYSLRFATRTVLLAGMTPYTDILKFYAVVLLLAPLLIRLRIRFSLMALLAFSVFVQLAYPIFKSLPQPELILGRDYLGPIAGFLYGGGHSGVGAPSLLHGLTFVIGGMLIGVAFGKLLSGDARERRAALLTLGGLMLLCVITVYGFWSGLHQVLQATAEAGYRNDNHPFYYALGFALTIAAASICFYLFDIRNYRWADGVTFIGKTSLFTFAFGNIILYLQPFSESFSPARHQLLVVSACIGLIILQSWLFAKLSAKTNEPANRFWTICSSAVRSFMAAAIAGLGIIVSPVAFRYASALGYDAKSAGSDGTASTVPRTSM